MIAKLVRAATYIVAIIGMLVTLAALAARQVPITSHAVLFVAAYSPYLMVGAAIAAVLLLLTRRWRTAAVAIALTAAAIAAELSLFIAATPPQDSAAVRVLTANLRVGEAEPNSLIDIANQNADVVVVQELTRQLADTLDQTGIKATFPYQALEPGEYGHGVGIWSRYPITASSRIDGYRLDMVSADIAVRGTDQDTVFVAVHLPGPWPQEIDGWRDEIDRLPTTLGEIKDKADGRPVIVAGDFNATYDMAPFRKLLTDGFEDAAEQSGAGITRTFPSDSTPRFGIDHVLTYNATATDVQTVRVPGSDHLGLLATVRLTPLR